MYRNLGRTSLFCQESGQEPWMLCAIVLVTVVLVVSVISLPPTYLVELLTLSSQWMVLSARVFLYVLLTLLRQISFHMYKNESNHEEISHPLPNPIDFIRVMQKMGISTETVTEISFPNVIILESTGGHHCHPYLVTKSSPRYIFRHFEILFLDLDNHSLCNVHSGPQYHDGSRMAHAPMYSGPPRESALPNNTWNYPPRSMNHRQFNPYPPPSEGPVPVANKGPSFYLAKKSKSCFAYYFDNCFPLRSWSD